jgi:hypothetical protein
MNDDQDSDLGIRDLIKLKKRLFDPEFEIIEDRYKQRTEALQEHFHTKFENLKAEVI